MGRKFSGPRSSNRTLLGCTPVEIHGIDIRQHEKCIGGEVCGKQSGGAILVDNGLDPLKVASSVADNGNSAAATIVTTFAVTNMRMTSIWTIRFGNGEETTRRHRPGASSATGQP